MEGRDITIDTEEIAEYLLINLTQRGFVPSDEEVEELADIVFDFLLDKCIIEDEDVE